MPTEDSVNMLDSKDVVLYRSLIKQSRHIILVVSIHGKIMEANQAAANAYGYSIHELQMMNIYELRSPDTIFLICEQREAARQQGIVFRTFHMRRNGARFPVEVNSQLVQLPEGHAVFSTIRDISEAVMLETVQATEKKSSVLHKELTAAYEELLASQAELSCRFDELAAKEIIISRQNVILTSLNDIAVGLMHKIDLDDVLAMIVESATQLIGTHDGFISLVDEKAGVFDRKVAVGSFAEAATRRIKVTEGLLGRVYRTGKLAIARDYTTWEHRLRHPVLDNTHYFIIIPLRRGLKVIGAFGLAFSEQGRCLAEHEVALLQRFGDLAAIALDNATLVSSYKQELQERRLAEEALRASSASNQALINAIPDPLFLLKHDGTVVDYKAGKEQLFMPSNRFIGKTVFEIFPAEIAAKILQSAELVLAGGDIQSFEYQLTVHGKVEHYEVRIVSSSDDEVLAINRTITERKRMEAQLEFLSLQDALTKVYNKAFFEEQIKRIQLLDDGAAGIIMCDVDGLKMVNDMLGHVTGDQILQVVAGILTNCCRAGDLIARIGGDEFAILLHSNSVKGIVSCSQQIRERIEVYNSHNPTVPISLSMGLAVCAQPPLDIHALLKQADDSMYREKLHRHNSTRSALVKALMKALEARDYITEGHGDRLQDLIEAFAGLVALPATSIADLRLFARFHDIGKVGIPDSILFKAGRLTAEEWVTMRQHCEIGYRIAMAAPDLVPIADWILKHHEWWDGHGYPLGLAGEAIPLACRMLSIADAFDAMTSDRPYRRAMSKEAAVAELLSCAGKQFDPDLVNKFCTLIQALEKRA